MFNPHLKDVHNPSLSSAAYSVYDRPARMTYIGLDANNCGIHKEVVPLVAGDVLYDATNHGRYHVNSCASYALADGKCPIDAYNRAVKNGHSTHFLIQEATVISNRREPAKKVIALDIDAVYYFEGRLFNIVRTFNRNLGFVEIK